MPAPNAKMMAQFAKQEFAAFGIVLPTDWKQPMGQSSDQYRESFTSPEHNAPDTSLRLFIPASTNKHHMDAVDKVGKIFGDYLDGICSAICSAWGQWMTTASISVVMVNGSVGVLSPGMLIGMPLTPLSFCQAPIQKPSLIPYSQAISTAVGTAWLAWATGYAGTLTYPPTFNAVPGPVHPPTPNIPTPVVSVGASPAESLLSPMTLKQSMVGLHGNPSAAFSGELFESVAKAYKKIFDIWVAQTLVTNVLAMGPNPLFVPPAFAPGPVVGGVGFGPPGCLV